MALSFIKANYALILSRHLPLTNVCSFLATFLAILVHFCLAFGRRNAGKKKNQIGNGQKNKKKRNRIEEQYKSANQNISEMFEGRWQLFRGGLLSFIL